MPLVQEGQAKAEPQGPEEGLHPVVAHLPPEGPEPQEIDEGVIAEMAQGLAEIEVDQVKLGRAQGSEPGQQPFQNV